MTLVLFEFGTAVRKKNIDDDDDDDRPLQKQN